MKKRALLTGVTGQDGSYLAEFLLDKGYALPEGQVTVFVERKTGAKHSSAHIATGSVRVMTSAGGVGGICAPASSRRWSKRMCHASSVPSTAW